MLASVARVNSRARAVLLVLAVLVGLLAASPSGQAEVAAKPKPPKPVVTKVKPASGPASGGTVVKVKGQHLTGATKVLFGTVKGTGIKVKNDKKLTVVAPAHAPGVVKVRVVTKGGKSAKKSAPSFTYLAQTPAPAVTAVSPATGTVLGGSVVTVTGTALSGATSVTFGGTPGTALSSVTATSLTVKTPAHAVGAVDVRVTTPGGTSAPSGNAQYTYATGPFASVAPLPSGAAPDPDVVLGSVSCPAAGACVAVGTWQKAGNFRYGLIEMQSGGSWTAVEAPLPAGASVNPKVFLNEVDCVAADACVAVGSYASDSGPRPLVLQWNGATWTPAAVTTSVTIGAFVDLIGISCATSGSCAAVGSYQDLSASILPLVGRLASGTWTLEAAPLPVGSVQGDLRDVSCPAAADCVAVGRQATVAVDLPLAETLSGTTWTDSSPALPAGGLGGSLDGVDCPAPGVCAAVGYHVAASGSFGTLERLAAGTWTATAVAAPAGSSADPGFGLRSVSCPTTVVCAATGAYQTATGLQAALVQTNGGTVTASTAVPLPGAGTPPFPSIANVRCAAVGSCITVGQYNKPGPVGVGLIGRLDGTTVTGATAPLAPGTSGTSLFAVDHTGLVGVAVGNGGGPGGGIVGVLVTDIPLPG